MIQALWKVFEGYLILNMWYGSSFIEIKSLKVDFPATLAFCYYISSLRHTIVNLCFVTSLTILELDSVTSVPIVKEPPLYILPQ